MKASRRAYTDHTNLKLSRWWDVQQERKRKPTMPKDDPTETLARMWIACDPNRGGSEVGSGFHPDDKMTEAAGDLKDQPRWKWFVPRAEATIKFLRENGYELRRTLP